MPRIATQDFTLTLDGGRPVEYSQGQQIDPAHEAHWFAQHQSEPVQDEDQEVTQIVTDPDPEPEPATRPIITRNKKAA